MMIVNTHCGGIDIVCCGASLGSSWFDKAREGSTGRCLSGPTLRRSIRTPHGSFPAAATVTKA